MTLLGRSYFGVYVSVAFMNQTLKFLVKLGRIHLSQLLQVGKRINLLHKSMLHLNSRGFSLLKSLLEMNLNQMTINSLVFRSV